MTSSSHSPVSPPARGAAAAPWRGVRDALPGVALLATFMAAWAFLVLAVAEPAARLGQAGAARRGPEAETRLAAAPARPGPPGGR